MENYSQFIAKFIQASGRWGPVEKLLFPAEACERARLPPIVTTGNVAQRLGLSTRMAGSLLRVMGYKEAKLFVGERQVRVYQSPAVCKLTTQQQIALIGESQCSSSANAPPTT